MKFNIDVDAYSVDLGFFITVDLPQKYTVACAITGADNVLVSVPGLAAAYKIDPDQILPFASDVHSITLSDGQKVDAMWIVDVNEAFYDLFGRPFYGRNIETLRQKPVLVRPH